MNPLAKLSSGTFDLYDPTSDLFNVVIEAPLGSRCKYKYDEQSQIFRVNKLLPLGASFPFNYGYVPATRGQDGDPLDVLVLINEPLIVGSVVPVRMIGVIEAEQTELTGKTVKNDRLLAALETKYNGLSRRKYRYMCEIEEFASAEHCMRDFYEYHNRKARNRKKANWLSRLTMTPKKGDNNVMRLMIVFESVYHGKLTDEFRSGNLLIRRRQKEDNHRISPRVRLG